MRSASRAIGASRVLALQGLGSCSHLSPNLVCASRRQPPPAAIKADGEADTARITQSVSDTALPSREGGTPEQASPLEGLGGEADQGGRRANRGAPPKASGRESATEASEARSARPPRSSARPERAHP